MRYQVVSCIKGDPKTPRRIAGITTWSSREEAERALNSIWSEPDHPDPDDFVITTVEATP